MNFWRLAGLISDMAGLDRLEAVVSQEIQEDSDYLAKLVCDGKVSDAELGKRFRASLEITLSEEADYQQDIHANEVMRGAA